CAGREQGDREWRRSRTARRCRRGFPDVRGCPRPVPNEAFGNRPTRRRLGRDRGIARGCEEAKRLRHGRPNPGRARGRRQRARRCPRRRPLEAQMKRFFGPVWGSSWPILEDENRGLFEAVLKYLKKETGPKGL